MDIYKTHLILDTQVYGIVYQQQLREVRDVVY